jgi:Enolase C-terminal domain-like
MLEDHPLLRIDRDFRLPRLTPFNSHAPKEIEEEVERRLAEGFRTFKIKVGKDADDDARRVAAVQRAIAGRATIRIDANRAYGRADACRFAAALDPSGIELFEQPCDTEAWEANAAVATVSPVPIMLDEPICSVADVKLAVRYALPTSSNAHEFVEAGGLMSYGASAICCISQSPSFRPRRKVETPSHHAPMVTEPIPTGR